MEVKTYRKKPVEIEAIEWTGENLKEIIGFVGDQAMNYSEIIDPAFVLKIKTLEGEHVASKGDYIIKGVKGEFYPCKPDIFKMTYGLVEDDEGILNDSRAVMLSAEDLATLKPIATDFICIKDPCVFVQEDDSPYQGGAHNYFLTECLGYNATLKKTDFITAEYTADANVGPVFTQMQKISFVQKSQHGDHASVKAGITREQVLFALRHSLEEVNKVYPSEFNEKAIHHITQTLVCLEQRIADRQDRGVMGELKK